jgi:hypothetical protein
MIYLPYAIVASVFAARLADGREHGLHWASLPSVDTGRDYHAADWVETWALRAIYAAAWAAIAGWTWMLAPILLGWYLADQALWQMVLNASANNTPFGGEQRTATFAIGPVSWTTPKLFRNERRLVQLALGALLFTSSYLYL